MDPKSAPLHVAPATADDKVLVARLMQIYLRELTGILDGKNPSETTEAGGVFEYRFFDHYWQEPGREPLLIRRGQLPIGFAFVNGWSALGQHTDYAMAEFFILREFRRVGAGACAAQSILSGRPGRWEIAVGAHNTSAFKFWKSVLTRAPFSPFEQKRGDGDRWSGTVFCGQIRAG